MIRIIEIPWIIENEGKKDAILIIPICIFYIDQQDFVNRRKEEKAGCATLQPA
ncbi:hypothetical protein VU08_02945 [Desulfobulbus sp. F5]|nr:hypothetical protein [Desulfobulbus sp. F5]